MKIKKRNGSIQAFMPNKLLKRIKDSAKGLSVNPENLFQSVVPSIEDGMTTTEIDEIIAFASADKILEHSDYSVLGGRILISRQSKLIEKPLQDVDLTYDFFAATTFLKKYSKRDKNDTPLELPSCMYERVASILSENDKDKKELIKELHAKRVNFATPIYTNCGIENRGAMISCNLTHLEDDSIEGIENTLTKISYASKEGAGIGLLIDPIRSKHSIVNSFNGKAGGVVRLADMVQSKMRFYKQGSRSGSCALYLSVWHRDIVDFLNLVLPVGDEQLRTRDLFTSVIINDLFMEKLSKRETWHIFCPDEIKRAGLKPLYSVVGDEFKEVYNQAVEMGLGKEIDPKDIWDRIIKSQVESGRPYVFFKDNANKRNMQDNIGVIKQSNLCISENSIIDIIVNGKEHKVDIKTLTSMYNSDNYNNILIKSYNELTNEVEYKELLNAVNTNDNAEVLEITDEESGKKIICTPEHEIYTLNRGYVMAKNLQNTDKLKILN